MILQDFIEFKKTKDLRLRNKIVRDNEKLVSYIITKMYKVDESIKEDLRQQGLIGLIFAIENFKPEMGFQFSTYATVWIRQEINKFLSENNPLIIIPPHIRALQAKAKKVAKEQGIELKLSTIPQNNTFGLTTKQMERVVAAFKSKQIVFFEEVLKNCQEEKRASHRFIDTLSDGSDLEEDVYKEEFLQAARRALEKLPEKKQLILKIRFGCL